MQVFVNTHAAVPYTLNLNELKKHDKPSFTDTLNREIYNYVAVLYKD